MPEYLSPGVYIEELAGPKPIQGVGTSTGAFVGIAERGPVNSPQLITNLTQFGDVFGSFMPKAYLAYGVQHFFMEGGTRAYVVRAFKPSVFLDDILVETFDQLSLNEFDGATDFPNPDHAEIRINGVSKYIVVID